MNPSTITRPLSLPIVSACTRRISERSGPHADRYLLLVTDEDSVVDLRWIRGLAARLCDEPVHLEFVGPFAATWASATRAAVARHLSDARHLSEAVR